MTSRRGIRHLRALAGLLGAVTALVLVYSTIFHLLMTAEGRAYSWFTGVYWTVQTMTTLGYGDLTFTRDTGLAFSLVVLLSGLVLLFVLLPYTLIQFFYSPWLERQNAARTPRDIPPDVSNHVILTAYGPVEAILIQRFDQYAMPYTVIVPDTARALELHDHGVNVMIGHVDDADTYRRAGIERAALVATTLGDAVNANVALTVRECSSTVPIVATAAFEMSGDLLKQAGCQNVIQLGELLGRAMARRITSDGGRPHVIGQLDGLVIAEAAVAGTTLAGQTIGNARVGERLHVNIVGVWDKGAYSPGSAGLLLTHDMTLLLSGTQNDVDAYAREYSHSAPPAVTALIVGGGRVGRATSRALSAAGIEHRVVEREHVNVPDRAHWVFGDATDPAVLDSAGLDTASSVAITTHDDDLNVYLTLYCRSKRPDIKILSRSTHQQNVATLRLAGANFVMSYVPMEANAIFDVVRHGSVLSLVEGLEVFTVRVPRALTGKSIADCNLRRETGCNVLAVRAAGGAAAPPDINAALLADSELVLIGDREDERRFFERYGKRPLR
ncbi:MAG TPA: NAD-binding protein [Vicinamibacterales bacterium]|nr:NAD-binding protein [Vicinamibacterales bacterium]